MVCVVGVILVACRTDMDELAAPQVAPLSAIVLETDSLARLWVELGFGAAVSVRITCRIGGSVWVILGSGRGVRFQVELH